MHTVVARLTIECRGKSVTEESEYTHENLVRDEPMQHLCNWGDIYRVNEALGRLC